MARISAFPWRSFLATPNAPGSAERSPSTRCKPVSMRNKYLFSFTCVRACFTECFRTLTRNGTRLLALPALSEASSGEYVLRCETSSEVWRSVSVSLRVVKSEKLSDHRKPCTTSVVINTISSNRSSHDPQAVTEQVK